MRDLCMQDEVGRQGVGRDQEDGYASGSHPLLDLFEPFLPRSDSAVIPGFEKALLLEDGELLDQAVLPDLIPVAIADEDRRR
jgi:hypothetical protein